MAELEKEAGQMAEECETCEWWWKRGDWKMRRKERRLEKKVEEDGNRVALLQQRRLNAGLPGWDCWSRRLTHSHRMEGQCGCFPHWPGQILFLRNSNESDQRTLCTCSCRPFYTFSVWQQQYATRNHAASHQIQSDLLSILQSASYFQHAKMRTANIRAGPSGMFTIARLRHFFKKTERKRRHWIFNGLRRSGKMRLGNLSS